MWTTTGNGMEELTRRVGRKDANGLHGGASARAARARQRRADRTRQQTPASSRCARPQPRFPKAYPLLPLAVAAEHTTRVELTTALAISFARYPMGCAYLVNDLQSAPARPLHART